MKHYLFTLLFAALFVACSHSGKEAKANYQVIPLPQSIDSVAGKSFSLTQSTKIVYPAGDAKMKQLADFLSDYIKLSTGITLQTTEKEEADNVITLKTGYASDNKEAYNLTVTDKSIQIQGASEAAVFYGIQTLRKSLPEEEGIAKISLPQVNIKDYPRFAYRGMMLDVGRHFFPVEFVKKYIDILALHNINRFHWHLTDDQGWRIEIKKYPKLTEIGSQRKETVIGRNTSQSDGKPYGGFYTQEQIKDVVAYAQARYITIVPEIDLPGHMLAALTAYPELGCTGGSYEVGTKWGVYDDVLCAGNDKTYEFLKDVYSEVIELFPSEYIHIGGDECPKVRWKECPKCQAKIKALGLKADNKHTAEERLQSHVISEIEKFLNSKGRKIIGWDEILEGGLAPNATVMSWRGTDGGKTAAQQGHEAIMTPTSHMYFDYYQSENTKDEPLAFGGIVTLDKVYSFEPVPQGLTPEQQKYIIGTQANLWTEYIATPEHAEYMVLPRMAALAEVQWTMPEKKDYKNFLPRLFRLVNVYDKLGYNYSKRVYDVQSSTKLKGNAIEITLSTIDNADIYYTLDGSVPTAKSSKYSQPINVDKTAQLKAVAIRGGVASSILGDSFNFNKATLKTVKTNVEPSEKYTFGGTPTLVDARRGGGSFGDGTWIGYYGKDVEFVVDLGASSSVSSTLIGTFVSPGDWIFGATSCAISLSEDNKTFKEVYKQNYPVLDATQATAVIDLVAKFKPQNARYVKINVSVTKSIPEWHTGKGQPSFLFFDEIIVE